MKYSHHQTKQHWEVCRSKNLSAPVLVVRWQLQVLSEGGA